MRLPRTVVALGLVALFNDLASEIVVPLIPILLSTTMGVGPVVLGLVEGVADAVAAFLKLWSGQRSDALGGRRKGLTLAGYLLSNLARPLLGLAQGWGMILVLRSIDRVGKGLRTAPRDALIADVTAPRIRGYAYGFNRALDNAGAVAGSLLAAGVLTWSQTKLAQVILLSAIPGAIAVLTLLVGVKETHTAKAHGDTRPALAWGALSRGMRRYLLVVGFFTLGRASETFIVLLGHERGAPVVELLLLWAALNAAKATTSTLGGRLADQIPRGIVVGVSWLAFAVTFWLFALVPVQQALWLITVGYGLFAGFGEGAERAVISDFATQRERGAAFGWYNFVLGLAAIPGGLLFGGLWHYYGNAAAFAAAGVIALVSVVLLRGWAWPRVAASS